MDQPFLMPIEDVFGIKGRGTVVTGRIERGQVKTGEEIEIIGLDRATRKVVVTGVEMFRKTLDSGQAGDNVGCLLRGIERDDVERGQVLAKPGSIKPHTKLRGGGVRALSRRGWAPYALLHGLPPAVLLPHHRRDGLDVTLPEGIEMVMPGDNVRLERRTDYAGGDGRGPALRHPRGRPHRRRRRRH